jgi:octaprenyl-diphosphate synthase
MSFESIKAPVLESFQAVDALIMRSLHSKASIVNDLGYYIIQSGGKRVRPLVILLIAKACGYQGTQDVDLAAIIEFIHTATLLHDDVVDNAHLRRGTKSANHIWGNEAAVLVGDYLYSKAFQILVTIENPKIAKVLADATNIMAEGEALQLMERHHPTVTEDNYLTIIRAKTAKLFEAAAQIGAILGLATPELEMAMAQYGLHLGTAFQLVDDMLDYQSSPAEVGKNTGSDLTEGKVTLPLIHVLQNSTPGEMALVKTAIKNGGAPYLKEIQELILNKKSLEYTLNVAKLELAQAEQSLLALPDSPYRNAATALARFAINRTY